MNNHRIKVTLLNSSLIVVSCAVVGTKILRIPQEEIRKSIGGLAQLMISLFQNKNLKITYIKGEKIILRFLPYAQ